MNGIMAVLSPVVSRWVDTPPSDNGVEGVEAVWRTKVRAGLYDRMLVEVRRHSPTAAEVVIVPASRGFARWGERRAERYFAAAHDIADRVACAVSLGRAASSWQGRQAVDCRPTAPVGVAVGVR